MKTSLLVAALALAANSSNVALADFAGPSHAYSATSPDGNLIVRIKDVKAADKANKKPSYEVAYYEYDPKFDGYLKRSEFALADYLGHLMYLSDSGDLILVELSEKDAVRLYRRSGELVKKWNLNDFLTRGEVQGCAQTGSTLQWLEEGRFQGRTFSLRGPSQSIRAVSAPLTVMRGVNGTVRFSASIDCEKAKLRKER